MAIVCTSAASYVKYIEAAGAPCGPHQLLRIYFRVGQLVF